MQKLKTYLIIVIILALQCVCGKLFAQTSPTDQQPGDPGALSIYTIQNLHFGAFTQGAIGGTIGINSAGQRTSTGDIVLLNMGVSFFEAIFEVEGIVGVSVSILNGPRSTLTGSNGGSMSMSIGSCSPSSPFINTVQPPGRTQVHIGGTLNVGAPASNPPGTYSGTFYVTFNQE